jgi:hypothetical protein
VPVYELRLKGHLCRRWSDWFGGLQVNNLSRLGARLAGSNSASLTVHLGSPFSTISRPEDRGASPRLSSAEQTRPDPCAHRSVGALEAGQEAGVGVGRSFRPPVSYQRSGRLSSMRVGALSKSLPHRQVQGPAKHALRLRRRVRRL